MTSLSAVVPATGFEHFTLPSLAVAAAAATLVSFFFLKKSDQAFETIE